MTDCIRTASTYTTDSPSLMKYDLLRVYVLAGALVYKADEWFPLLDKIAILNKDDPLKRLVVFHPSREASFLAACKEQHIRAITLKEWQDAEMEAWEARHQS